MIMKYQFIIFLLVTLFSLSSCYTTRHTYSGNIHEQCIGKSKNEILRIYGTPERIQDDGAGGSILVYEQLIITTFSIAIADDYDSSAIVGVDIYNMGGKIDACLTGAVQGSSMNEINQTSINKPNCKIFVNAHNVVYDFKSNYGALYKTTKKLKKTLTCVTVVGSCMVLFLHQFFLANSQD